jgi:hypothetical protein
MLISHDIESCNGTPSCVLSPGLAQFSEVVMKTVETAKATEELAQMLKGVYERVSRDLGLNPYFVSRAARGELQSKLVEEALERELKKVLAQANRQNGRNGAGARNGRARTSKAEGA